ncbi:baseplate wedge subunit [Morganella phage vB_Mm5]
MSQQIPKKLIDLGEIGNPSTGDYLFEGGGKINDVIENVYNAWGDQRLLKANNGIGQMIIHATGYYQKLERTYYLSGAIDIGSCHDLDTSGGALSITLPKGKIGEGCYFINTNSSFSVERPAIITPQTGESISGINGSLIVTSPATKVVLWCVRREGSGVVWNYSIESMFGNQSMPVNLTRLVNETEVVIPLFYASEFSSAKLLTHTENMTGGFVKSSEILLSINSSAQEVYHTEYASLRSGDDKNSELYTIRFFVNTNGMVYAGVKSLSGRLNFSLKSIATVKAGIAT